MLSVELFREWTQFNMQDMLGLLPCLGFLFGGLGILCLELFLPKHTDDQWVTLKQVFAVTFFGLTACASVFLLCSSSGSLYLFSESILVNGYGHFSALLFSVMGMAVVMMTQPFHILGSGRAEYLALLFFAALGMTALVMSANFIVLFIALELMSLCVYMLIASKQVAARFVEGALKYFLLGALASAFLLMGIALMFAGTGSYTFIAIASQDVVYPYIMSLGVGFFCIGLFFKFGLIPFHMYIPDAYQGAPSQVTAFMAVGVKVAIFMAAVQVLSVLTSFDESLIYGILGPFIVLTVVGANFMALKQENVKRMLAYSSIAHAGYLGLGLFTLLEANQSLTIQSTSAILIYLSAYGLATLGAFALLCQFEAECGEDQLTFDHFNGIAAVRPDLAFKWLVFMISLAGIPVSAGFVGKYLVFSTAVENGAVGLTLVAVLGSLLSLYYYFRIPLNAFFKSASSPHHFTKRAIAGDVVVWFCMVMTLVLGLTPHKWISWVTEIVLGMGQI